MSILAIILLMDKNPNYSFLQCQLLHIKLEAFLGMNILHSFSNRLGLDAKKVQMC